MHTLTPSANQGKFVRPEQLSPKQQQPWWIMFEAAKRGVARTVPKLFGGSRVSEFPCADAVAENRPTFRRRSGIYVASKTIHAATWRKMRDEHGVNIIATWIDEAEAGQTACLRDLSWRCIDEATRCERFVLFCDDGEILRGALLECGAALASGINVYCVGDCPSISRVFENHPLWHKCPNIEAAFDF